MLYEFQSKTVTPKQLKLYKKFLSVIFCGKTINNKGFSTTEDNPQCTENEFFL